ncbi:MAG: PQQ-dependent sugar dehydrogenase [Gemmatimonadota bacterium]
MQTRSTRSTALLLMTVLATACAERAADPADGLGDIASTDAVPGAQGDCVPLETREPNDPDQEPASPAQTRACGIESSVAFDVAVVASGLENPWAVEPLPDGGFLVTEKPGRMRIVSAGGDVGEPIAGIPEVDSRGQGGLLDVTLSPSFESDRLIYWSYAEPRGGGNGTTVARGVLSTDRSSLEEVEILLRAMPTYDGRLHYGSRLAFGPAGHLYITTGDRSDEPMREYAQRLDSHLGKVLRINADGSVPDDNPFVDEPDAAPAVWSLGHRNIQAASFDPQGRLWTVEHGPRGGDELNLIHGAVNYGWPIVTYGIEYSGDPIADAVTQREGFQQPVYYWDPVIAPSGAQWYTGNLFPEWQGSLFIGALREMRLVRLVIEDEQVIGEEHLLTDRQQRIRDVRQGPDGALYLVTDHENGELLRIAPR